MPSFPLIYFHRPSTACGAFDFRVRRRPVSPDCSHPSFSSTCHTQLCTCLLTVVVVVVVQVYARLVHLLQYMHVDNFPSLMFYDDGCGLRKFAGASGGRRFPRHCNDHPPVLLSHRRHTKWSWKRWRFVQALGKDRQKHIRR